MAMAGAVVVAEGVGVVVRMGSLETKAAGVRHADFDVLFHLALLDEGRWHEAR